MVRQLRARPRLFIAAWAAIAIGYALPLDPSRHFMTRLLIAWNTGTGFYVPPAVTMVIRSSSRHMRRRAQLKDDGELVTLILVVISSVLSLVAIAVELAVVKEMHGWLRIAHVTLAGVTILSSWAFIQVMFTLHYARD